MLYKRGNKWWLKLSQNGRPVYESTGIKVKSPGVAPATLRQEAKRVHDARAGEIAKGTFLPRADRVSYDELAQDLRRHVQNTGTRNPIELEKRLKHLDQFFLGMRATAIDASAVERYVERRKGEGAAPGTVNRETGVLVRLFRLAMQHRRVSSGPVVHKLEEPAPRSGFFEREQFEWVKKRLPDDLQVAVSIAHTYGWRMQSEVLALEKRHVDLDAGTLRLDPGSTKNDEGRVVYLTAELKRLLTAQLERVKALEKRLGRVIPYLFPHLGVKGGHVSPKLVGTQRRDFRKAWVTACVAAGLGTVDPETGKKSAHKLRHDFRRTAARNLVEQAGVSERVAMKVTGHRTRSVFDRYHIVSAKDLQVAAQRLDQISR